MSWRVIIRPNAETDAREARQWYESQRAGLGDELLEEIRHAVHLLKEHPERRPIYYRGVRRLRFDLNIVMANVQLKQVVKRFGDTEVIHGIDLEIRSGEFVVFVGPSGCGKSTLLRMIAGLETTTRGDI